MQYLHRCPAKLSSHTRSSSSYSHVFGLKRCRYGDYKAKLSIQCITGLVLLLFLVLAIFPPAHPNVKGLRDEGGAWVAVGCEYHGLLLHLPVGGHWQFNRARGVGEMWTVNLTVSWAGLKPISVFICDEKNYHNWLESENASFLALHWVNSSINFQQAFPRDDNWFLVVNNTRPAAQVFTITITLYQWSAVPHPQALPDLLGGLAGWFLSLLVVVFVIIPFGLQYASRRRRIRRDDRRDREW